MGQADTPLTKRPTGIAGLDAVTRGGLPDAGGVLVLGGPGAGKTILGLQILASAIANGDGGLFISFEESPAQILRDAGSFDWGETLTESDAWALLDGRPPVDATASGGFDLEGLLAIAGQRLDHLGGGWLILDGIDQLLSLEPDARAALDQIRHLNDWCEARRVTLLLSGKRASADAARPLDLEGIEFMLSTVLVLSAELVGRRLNRRFRIAKYRGSAHVTDELPMVMDDAGLHLPYSAANQSRHAPVSYERVGMGIPRLDHILGGGIYRGSTVLVSGAPGTAKTTLAVGFARAAVDRGERVLYLTFDELGDRIVRNAASVGIELQPGIDSGLLRIESREAWNALVEEHFITIHRWLDAFQPDCMVIDPVSALLKSASADSAYMTTERILGEARARGITILLTSLIDTESQEQESTLSHVSTLADSWISLEYRVHGGERNRALSIVKSRGSAHSNQVRELLLSDDGVALADVYEYGSEVLMGTARMQKEHEVAERSRRAEVERGQRRRDLERNIEQARLRMQEAQSEAERLSEVLERERQGDTDANHQADLHRQDIRRRRAADDQTTGPNRGNEE
ncbi:ATPase domain-containing protein [Halofilum ochraceum]|uniref:ATPase domain-containing protein n=1 Tax=Halofilum ochraceum TaxID=1611323 RepID=UPI0008299CD3|nr:ATPase domain-containing protein [Halofilum ochraceum]